MPIFVEKSIARLAFGSVDTYPVDLPLAYFRPPYTYQRPGWVLVKGGVEKG